MKIIWGIYFSSLALSSLVFFGGIVWVLENMGEQMEGKKSLWNYLFDWNSIFLGGLVIFGVVFFLLKKILHRNTKQKTQSK
jgi:hypothetical protein